MKKIRINELARELEVKPNKILELLPELGVQEKKTHSSSIDEDVALHVKDRLIEEGAVRPDVELSIGDRNGSARPEHREPEHTREARTASPSVTAPEPPQAETEEAAGGQGTPAAESAPATGEETRQSSPTPLRPPLVRLSGPRAPLQPPVGGQTKAAPPPPTVQVAPGPAAPPSQPTPGTPARPTLSARNMPIYRPGQVLSGPRQPLPPNISPSAPAGGSPPGTPLEARTPGSVIPGAPRPGAPSAPVRPGAPRPTPPPSITVPRGGPSQPQQPSAGVTPGAPTPGAPTPRPPIAGQPAARPVVPPRADLAARLAQNRGPGATTPGAPRPGMPSRPASPVPGQPIYRGPIRPGQPLMRGPGQPGAPGAFQNRGPRPRPMHPTSPMRMEPAAPVPTDTQRRTFVKPGGRTATERRRDEQEGKIFRQPMSRREAAPPPPIDREITISEGVTVKELADKLGIKANLVIKKLVEHKIFATINQSLDAKMAEDLSREFGASTNRISYEQEATQEITQAEVEKDLIRRAPVVTIMGHVDHGKTSLLDSIRATNVADREAGGITQHIGASTVVKNDRKIVFIDTPGHEAFTRMRARGAKVTDIVVLVVAADDGVMPQTLEAIDHARAAGVPIIVAINKIDKPDAQPERIKQQLADRNLLAEDWGGETVMVPVSAKAKTNLDLLLEMILLVADMADLKANPARPAVGTVLEAQLDRGRGPVATVLVQNGTLRIGDFFICGQVFGKVRAMFGDRGEPIKDAEPSTPVEVLGLDALPEVGDAFQVVTDTAKAKQIVMYREAKARETSMAKSSRITLEQLQAQAREGETKDLNIILKTDVGGTAEVLSEMLQKLSTDKIKIRVLARGVGAITESDVLLATTSNAIIIGFNVRPERAASALAEREKVDIRLHTIIYELTDEIKKAMTGLLEPVYREVFRGRAEVREVFKISKVGTVAGCMVIEGTVARDSQIRILRDNVVVHTGRIDTLKRFKNDASEVKQGFECGITIANFQDIKPGDIIEAYGTERVATEL